MENVEILAALLINATMIAFAVRNKLPTLLMFSGFSALAQGIPLAFGPLLHIFEYSQLGAAKSSYADDSVGIASISLLGTAIGYILSRARRSDTLRYNRSPATLKHQFSKEPSLNKAISYVLLLSILVAIMFYPDGPIGFVRKNLERVPIESSLNSLIYMLIITFGFVILACTIEALRSNRRLPRLSILISLMLFASIGGRVQFVIQLLTYLLAFRQFGRLTNNVRIIMIASFAVLASFTILYLRLSLQGANPTFDSMAETTFNQLSMLDAYNLAAQYVAQAGNHVALYVDAIQQLVPRAIFEDKPTQISKVFRYMFFLDQLGGIPPGLFGEFYIMGSYLGCLAWGVIFGVIMQRLDLLYGTPSSQTALGQALTASFIPIVAIFLPRGGLDNSVFRIAITLSVFLACRGASRAHCAVLRKLSARSSPLTSGRQLTRREEINSAQSS